ncbi:hypothetical protein HG530_003652 [Fusarium avenaceum]|nr:hypothetical protein HG530_003652 [Fusarium avenaceum]
MVTISPMRGKPLCLSMLFPVCKRTPSLFLLEDAKPIAQNASSLPNKQSRHLSIYSMFHSISGNDDSGVALCGIHPSIYPSQNKDAINTLIFGPQLTQVQSSPVRLIAVFGIDISSALISADESQANTAADGGKCPDACIRSSSNGINTVHGLVGGKERVDRSYEGDNGCSSNNHLGLNSVTPHVPPNGLSERCSHGVKLVDLVVLLSTCRRRERRKNESAGGDAEQGRHGENGSV